MSYNPSSLIPVYPLELKTMCEKTIAGVEKYRLEEREKDLRAYMGRENNKKISFISKLFGKKKVFVTREMASKWVDHKYTDDLGLPQYNSHWSISAWGYMDTAKDFLKICENRLVCNPKEPIYLTTDDFKSLTFYK